MSLDFFDVKEKVIGKKTYAYPAFSTEKSNDIMIRGRDFYAFWDEKEGLWCRDIYKLIGIIDNEIRKYVENSDNPAIIPQYVKDFESKSYETMVKYLKLLRDNYKDLDEKMIFSNMNTKKTDYVSKKISYPLEEHPIPAYDELMSVLYDKKERRKIEWAIGSIITGDSKDIQKFFVLYGSAGTGKSTVLNIIKELFEDHVIFFRAKDLGTPSNRFALEPFAVNPLVAIDHDADLSKIEDNTRLNTLISHEFMAMEQKNKSIYTMKSNSMIFVGTNSPVKITDAKSGIIRRLVDISPSGRLLTFDRYNTLMNQILFELSGIAYHCQEVYLTYGKNYYDKYKPTEMMDKTNDMFNFVSDMMWDWDDKPYISLASAWKDYKDWCQDSAVQYPLMKRKFKDELKNYFGDFIEHNDKGSNLYYDFIKDKFRIKGEKEEKEAKNWLTMIEQKSLLDDILSDCKAQYANEDDIPRAKWISVKTKLIDIDTSKTHFVKVPENHIVIDFDIKNSKGEKDFMLNLVAASKFPQTYAELSKGGSGIHLHYIYDGDVSELSRVYDDDIEVKVFTGNSALRRRLTKCNCIPLTKINSGLPKKGVSKMIDERSVESEKHLRALIKKCLNKETWGHTKPEVDFIKKLVDDAYASDLSYDIRDLKPKILTFAMGSSNQSQVCYDICSKLKYCSKDHEEENRGTVKGTVEWDNSPIVFYDVEVFPNLFIICWKKLGDSKDNVIRMINPTPEEVKKLFSYRLVGFNNRRYDNHIIYARSMGYTNLELFHLSQKIIGKIGNPFFGEAYGLSYTDILDYCSNDNKMGLKKWEIRLGIFHMENAYPWDQDVPEDKWEEIADYCCNDVIATEAVWNATQPDFRGRCILAELSGLTVNDSSNAHTQQIIFGDDRHPQDQFNYPDLSKEFPGYKFDKGVSTYMGETVGEGGWVFSRPGMYVNGVCEDVSGMHPHSIYAMKLFGDEYTERYYNLVRARTYIKHGEYDKVSKMFDGKLAKYLGSESEAKELSAALKTPINSVYGLTAAKFMNRCRDPRNVDNVVAKRGALFMITLKHKVEEMGYTVIHCKTDSIKIADPDDDILRFIEDFGKKYGYNFEIEDEFERICLVDKATFIAKTKEGKWEAKAATFAHPYIFKTMFSGEKVVFDDLRETKEVKSSSMYLDFNEGYPDVTQEEKELKKVIKSAPDDIQSINALREKIDKGHNYHFVGKVGLFTPVVDGVGGGILLSSEDGVKYDSVLGTKNYRWLESDTVIENNLIDKVDMRYYDDIAKDAADKISLYGDIDMFINGSHEEYEAYARSLLENNEEIPFD